MADDEKFRSMADEWVTFATMVMPGVARNSVQYTEMQKAFYAGASSLFHWLMTTMDEDADPTDADVARLDALNEELTAFFMNHPHAKRRH